MFPPAKGKVQGADDDSTGVNLLAHWFRCGEAVSERNDAEASKDAFFFPSARATARRERDDDASYGAAVPRSASSFASASLELSSASE